jgi:hypothetical protein
MFAHVAATNAEGLHGSVQMAFAFSLSVEVQSR